MRVIRVSRARLCRTHQPKQAYPSTAALHSIFAGQLVARYLSSKR